MREIIFRAWDGKKLSIGKAEYFDDSVNFRFEHFDIDCDKPILEQYIGLKDKNGKMIFEGDIVVCRYANEYTPVFQNGIYMAYNPKEMQTIQQPSTQFNIIWRNGCEVIGNIHDQKEDV